MTLPALPAQGSTDWYTHYSAVDVALRELQTAGTSTGTGTGTGTSSGGGLSTAQDLARSKILGPRFAVAGASDWLVTVASGLTVSIAAGSGISAGTVWSTTSAQTLTVAANSSGSTRYDLIVARWTWTTAGDGTVTVANTFAVIQGTNGAAPPTTRSLVPGTLYEGLVAIVAVRSGVSTLLSTDLTDMRLYGGTGGALTRAVGTFMAYVDAIVGTEVLVLANAGYGWQRFVYFGSSVWRGTRDVVVQTTAFTATTLTTSNGTTESGIATVTVTDPGYPYVLEVSATVQVAAAATSPAHVYARLDSTTGTLLSAEGIRSGALPAGELVSLTLSPYTSATLTGQHTVYLDLARMTGATGNVATNADGNLLSVKVRPA